MNNSNYSDYILYKRWTYSVIFFLMLTPSFRISSLPAIRLEEVAIIFLIALLFIKLALKKKIIITIGIQQIMLTASILIIPISIIFGLLLGYDGSVFDLFQLIRWVKYIFIYTVAISFISLSKSVSLEILDIYKFILKLSIVLSLISFQQFFNIFDLNEIYVPYVAPTQMHSLIGDYPWPRPVGFVGNSNELGFLFVLTSWIAFYMMINTKNRTKYLSIMSLNVIAMLLTLSRSSFVSFFGGSIIFIFMLIFNSNLKIKLNKSLKIVVLLLIAFIMSAILLNISGIGEDVFWRFFKLSDISSDNSWNARLNNWDENIQMFLDSPLLGVGPLRRAELLHAADNEWLLFLRSYGIVGTLVMILTFIVPNMTSLRKGTGILNKVVIIGMAIYMIPASVFHSLVLMPFIFIILALNHKNYKIFILN